MTRTAFSGSPAHSTSPRSTSRLITRLAATAAVVLACAACTSPPRASRTVPAADPAEPATSPSVPFGGAPAVADPLPASVLEGDPCTDALTPDRVQTSIGVRVAGTREDLPGIGPACAWSNRGTGGTIGVAYVLSTHTGLSGIYAQPKAAVWRPMPPVQGLPAIAHAGAVGEPPPTGFCQASVGIADTLSVDISLHLGSSKWDIADPCGEPLRQICDLVITTLRAKGRP